MDNEHCTSNDNSVQSKESTPPQNERKTTRGTRRKGVDSVTKKFLRNFDPEHSEREKRKLHRRLYQGHKRTSLYDEIGVHIETGIDMCDCLTSTCTGCHFPCPKCSSQKCGHECRNNRKWTYEMIENEGSDMTIRNPLLKEN